MDALPPGDGDYLSPEDHALAEFGSLWGRGEELRAVVTRLPGELVLKSGLAARRKNVLERWDNLESPELDGSIPDGAPAALAKWNHDAEVLISYIVKIGREARDPYRAPDGRVYSAAPTSPDDLPMVMDSMDESDFVDDDWCWPWPDRPVATQPKPKWDKSKLVKFGVVAGLGVMAIVTYLDEE